MNKKRQLVIATILSVLLGAFFIFSAYSKTTPNLNYFEAVIRQQIGVMDIVASVGSRFFIGIEGAFGIMLLTTVWGRKKWVIKGTLLLMFTFTLHLILLWIRKGSQVDCGCMGVTLKMNVWQSILKNVVLIVLLFLLHKLSREDRNKYTHVLSIIVSVIIIAVPYVLYPVGHRAMPFSKLYSDQQPMPPKLNLKKGKHFVCFMSLTCPHCRDAAKYIHSIYQKNPDFPFYIFFPQEANDTIQAEQLADFKQDTKVTKIPYSFIKEKTFMDMLLAAGENGVPTMLWMEDTTIVRKMNVIDLSDPKGITTEMKKWLAQ